MILEMKKRILVVEDDSMSRKLLCHVLKQLDYGVLEPATDYKGAIRTFVKESPDLVILDVQLNGKNQGIEVANYIRNHADTPFIYLTSHADYKTLELAKATMPYAFLVKPFERDDIRITVDLALSNHNWFKKGGIVVKDEEMPAFTSMEKVILRKIFEESSTKEMALALNVSESTVKNHRHNICKKLKLPATTHSLLNWVLRNQEKLSF